jgi:hypothetical protein
MNYILVPYRDRATDYDAFVSFMPEFLTKLFGYSWRIIIVEQADGKEFNRGALLNAGFLLCGDVSGNYFLHDIDTLPASEVAQSRYALDCHYKIIGIYNSVCDTLGGIIKISGSMFRSMNGFPNNYFGWGVEDKALQNRASTYGFCIDKLLLNDAEGRTHFKIGTSQAAPRPAELGSRTTYEYNIFNTYTLEKRKSIIASNGLNTCTFNVIKQKCDEKITHFLIDF